MPRSGSGRSGKLWPVGKLRLRRLSKNGGGYRRAAAKHGAGERGFASIFPQIQQPCVLQIDTGVGLTGFREEGKIACQKLKPEDIARSNLITGSSPNDVHVSGS
jgi:hypothetical protein